MAEPKDTTSFFRKVVKFVANPATEWSDLDPPSQQARESEFAKSELKAMIERKRRNDFVRKREFDMLRKVRREGLSSEQLAALGGSSQMDDSEARIDSGDMPGLITAEAGVWALSWPRSLGRPVSITRPPSAGAAARGAWALGFAAACCSMGTGWVRAL